MAIRFRCRRCMVLLSIGARKAGTEIRCPRCGAAQTVPAAEGKPDRRANSDQTPSRSAAAAEAAERSESNSASAATVSSAVKAATLDLAEKTASPEPTGSTAASQSTAQSTLAETETVGSDNGNGTASAEADVDPPGVIVVYDYEDAYEPADEEIDSEAAGNPRPAQLPPAATAASAPADTVDYIPTAPAGRSSAERVFSEQPPRLGNGPQPAESIERGAGDRRRQEAGTSPSGRTLEAPPREPASDGRAVSANAATNNVPAPEEMVYLPRKIIFAQAWFLLAICGAAFAAGYWIGSGRPSGAASSSDAPEAQSRVFIEGLVSWTPMPGQTSGDENAVVILLPADRPPEPPIPMSGLRPVDPMPGELHRGLRAIKKAGGDYARTDAEGKFGLVAPAQGRYRILVISRHAGRVENAIAQEADFNEIGRYLQSPEMLIGRYKYHWRTEDVRTGFAPLEIHFGRDGKD